MDKAINTLMEQNAELSARNSELMGILLYVMERAPKERPSIFQLKKALDQERMFYKVGQVLKTRLEWIAGPQPAHPGSAFAVGGLRR